MAKAFVSLDVEKVKEKLEKGDYEEYGERTEMEFESDECQIAEAWIDIANSEELLAVHDSEIHVSIEREIDKEFLTQIIEGVTKQLNKLKTVLEALK